MREYFIFYQYPHIINYVTSSSLLNQISSIESSITSTPTSTSLKEITSSSTIAFITYKVLSAIRGLRGDNLYDSYTD